MQIYFTQVNKFCCFKSWCNQACSVNPSSHLSLPASLASFSLFACLRWGDSQFMHNTINLAVYKSVSEMVQRDEMNSQSFRSSTAQPFTSPSKHDHQIVTGDSTKEILSSTYWLFTTSCFSTQGGNPLYLHGHFRKTHHDNGDSTV